MGGAGTKKISAPKVAEYVKNSEIGEEVYDVVAKHRNTFRGKNLGTSYTDEQKSAVQNGTFEDLYVGDYWTINGFTWRIADIDYFYNQGFVHDDIVDIQKNHHLVIFPDVGLFRSKMEDSPYNRGYTGCNFYTNKSIQTVSLLKQAFGDFITDLYAVVNSSEKDTILATLPFMLPLNIWLRGYGINTNNPYNRDTNIGFQFRSLASNGQMALFRLQPNYIKLDNTTSINIDNETSYWMGDYYTLESRGGFGKTNSIGFSWWDWSDSSEHYIRPIFCIKG